MTDNRAFQATSSDAEEVGHPGTFTSVSSGEMKSADELRHRQPQDEKSFTLPLEKDGEEDAGETRETVTMATDQDRNALYYSVNDVPPWHLCILLGLQHFLTMFGSTMSIPLILSKPLCIVGNTLVIGELLGTMLFMSGLTTCLQTTLGVRLPIIQGGSFAFLAPTMAILSLEKWKCPAVDADISTENATDIPVTDPDDVWKSRIREIQGAIILASLFQVAMGILGLAGFIIRFIGPIAIASTITLIGLSLFETASTNCAGQWWIALVTIALIAVFSQYMRNIRLPVRCGGIDGIALFQLFPIILAMAIMWIICGILTWTDVLPDDPEDWGYVARVDAKSQVLEDAKWFRFPYPFQWGLPTFSVAAMFGMLAGVLAGMVESIGDYYACARISGAPPVPLHAMNRGWQ